MIITIRQAKIEDASILAEAERTIAQEPGFLCSQPSELKDETFARTIQELSPTNKELFRIFSANERNPTEFLRADPNQYLSPLPGKILFWYTRNRSE